MKLQIIEDFKGWHRFEYIWLIVSCLTMLNLSIYWQDSILGILSSLANIICVILIGKGKTSNFVWGFIGTFTYGIISYQFGYYGDTMLNFIYYVPMQFIGYSIWSKSRTNSQFKTNLLSQSDKTKLFFVCIVAISLYGYALDSIGGSLPYIDSASTTLSIIAMILMAKSYLEQWYIWVLVNLISIYMWVQAFVSTGNNVSTLIMWSIFLINSAIGLYNWKKMSKVL